MDINDTTVCINEKTVSVNMENIINRIVKRIIDILAGIIGTVLLIPLIIIIKVVSLITGDKGSIFFTQERIGKNGKVFKIYKFRTMIIGAEEELKRLLAENEKIRNEYAVNKKIKEDPRVTKIGKVLRKTSLDEFPQFLNILFGDMSLVGPRPYLEREKKDMGDSYQTIIKMKPGLTGLWQTSGRSNVNFEDRIKLDIEYYNNNSLLVDIKILFKTLVVVFFKKGAI